MTPKPDAQPVPEAASALDEVKAIIEATNDALAGGDAVRTSAQSEADPPGAWKYLACESAEEHFEAWFVETFHNVQGLTTEHFNRFRKAADQYKARLRAKES